MNFTLRAIVLSSRVYRVTDERSGEINEGVSIQYYPHDTMLPYFDEETKTKGRKVIDDSLPINADNLLTSVPGIYDITLAMTTVKNRNGQSKGQVKAKDIKYISDYIPQVEAGKK